MTKLHLTDHDLQLAADATPLSVAAALHLHGCSQCQGQLATYQHLFAGAARLPQPAFEFDLAAAVLARLPPAKPAFPWVVVLVGTLVLGVVGAFLVLLSGALGQLVQSWSSGLGIGLGTVAAFVAAGQCAELLAQHRRQMRLLAFS